MRYSYKKHHVTRFVVNIIGIYTALANMNEVANPEAVLTTADLPEHIHLYGDKGYRSDNNEELLKRENLKSSILYKAKKRQALTAHEKLGNKLIGKTRFKVERTFGSINRWFNSTGARYRDILKMHTQNLMEAIAYNLYRSLGILESKPIKTAK